MDNQAHKKLYKPKKCMNEDQKGIVTAQKINVKADCNSSTSKVIFSNAIFKTYESTGSVGLNSNGSRHEMSENLKIILNKLYTASHTLNGVIGKIISSTTDGSDVSLKSVTNTAETASLTKDQYNGLKNVLKLIQDANRALKKDRSLDWAKKVSSDSLLDITNILQKVIWQRANDTKIITVPRNFNMEKAIWNQLIALSNLLSEALQKIHDIAPEEHQKPPIAGFSNINCAVFDQKKDKSILEINAATESLKNLTRLEAEYRGLSDTVNILKSIIETTPGSIDNINAEKRRQDFRTSRSDNYVTVTGRSKKVTDICGARRCILDCLIELAEVRNYLKSVNYEEANMSDGQKFEGDFTKKKCCSTQTIPHFRADLNGIPIVIKLDQETIDTILPSVETYLRNIVKEGEQRCHTYKTISTQISSVIKTSDQSTKIISADNRKNRRKSGAKKKSAPREWKFIKRSKSDSEIGKKIIVQNRRGRHKSLVTLMSGDKPVVKKNRNKGSQATYLTVPQAVSVGNRSELCIFDISKNQLQLNDKFALEKLKSSILMSNLNSASSKLQNDRQGGIGYILKYSYSGRLLGVTQNYEKNDEDPLQRNLEIIINIQTFNTVCGNKLKPGSIVIKDAQGQETSKIDVLHNNKIRVSHNKLTPTPQLGEHTNSSTSNRTTKHKSIEVIFDTNKSNFQTKLSGKGKINPIIGNTKRLITRAHQLLKETFHGLTNHCKEFESCLGKETPKKNKKKCGKIPSSIVVLHRNELLCKESNKKAKCCNNIPTSSGDAAKPKLRKKLAAAIKNCKNPRNNTRTESSLPYTVSLVSLPSVKHGKEGCKNQQTKKNSPSYDKLDKTASSTRNSQKPKHIKTKKRSSALTYSVSLTSLPSEPTDIDLDSEISDLNCDNLYNESKLEYYSNLETAYQRSTTNTYEVRYFELEKNKTDNNKPTCCCTNSRKEQIDKPHPSNKHITLVNATKSKKHILPWGKQSFDINIFELGPGHSPNIMFPIAKVGRYADKSPKDPVVIKSKHYGYSEAQSFGPASSRRSTYVERKPSETGPIYMRAETTSYKHDSGQFNFESWAPFITSATSLPSGAKAGHVNNNCLKKSSNSVKNVAKIAMKDAAKSLNWELPAAYQYEIPYDSGDLSRFLQSVACEEVYLKNHAESEDLKKEIGAEVEFPQKRLNSTVDATTSYHHVNLPTPCQQAYLRQLATKYCDQETHTMQTLLMSTPRVEQQPEKSMGRDIHYTSSHSSEYKNGSAKNGHQNINSSLPHGSKNGSSKVDRSIWGNVKYKSRTRISTEDHFSHVCYAMDKCKCMAENVTPEQNEGTSIDEGRQCKPLNHATVTHGDSKSSQKYKQGRVQFCFKSQSNCTFPNIVTKKRGSTPVKEKQKNIEQKQTDVPPKILLSTHEKMLEKITQKRNSAMECYLSSQFKQYGAEYQCNPLTIQHMDNIFKEAIYEKQKIPIAEPLDQEKTSDIPKQSSETTKYVIELSLNEHNDATTYTFCVKPKINGNSVGIQKNGSDNKSHNTKHKIVTPAKGKSKINLTSDQSTDIDKIHDSKENIPTKDKNHYVTNYTLKCDAQNDTQNSKCFRKTKHSKRIDQNTIETNTESWMDKRNLKKTQQTTMVVGTDCFSNSTDLDQRDPTIKSDLGSLMETSSSTVTVLNMPHFKHLENGYYLRTAPYFYEIRSRPHKTGRRYKASPPDSHDNLSSLTDRVVHNSMKKLLVANEFNSSQYSVLISQLANNKEYRPSKPIIKLTPNDDNTIIVVGQKSTEIIIDDESALADNDYKTEVCDKSTQAPPVTFRSNMGDRFELRLPIFHTYANKSLANRIDKWKQQVGDYESSSCSTSVTNVQSYHQSFMKYQAINKINEKSDANVDKTILQKKPMDKTPASNELNLAIDDNVQTILLLKYSSSSVNNASVNSLKQNDDAQHIHAIANMLVSPPSIKSVASEKQIPSIPDTAPIEYEENEFLVYASGSVPSIDIKIADGKIAEPTLSVCNKNELDYIYNKTIECRLPSNDNLETQSTRESQEITAIPTSSMDRVPKSLDFLFREVRHSQTRIRFQSSTGPYVYPTFTRSLSGKLLKAVESGHKDFPDDLGKLDNHCLSKKHLDETQISSASATNVISGQEDKVCWALTKIETHRDGSQNLEILETSPFPPGHFLIPSANNVILLENQYRVLSKNDDISLK